MKVKKYDALLDASGAVYLAETGTFYNVDGRRVFNAPDLLADFFGDSVGIRKAADEHVYIACLDTKCRPIGCFEASHGSVNASMFPVREILQKSLLLGAVSIAVCHNHPSGDVTPSQMDIDATSRIKQACEICGLQLADHVIVGACNSLYYSFFEKHII